MADTERVVTPPAQLRLPGHEPTPVQAEVLYRPRSVRLTRALLFLGGFWVLAPIVFFIPPHIPWALLAFGAGIYFAWANWSGSYEVRTLEGTCPRCGNPLSVKPGSKISLPYKMTCYHCHHEPQLEMVQLPE